jgi:hypothetical protein
LRYLIKNDGLPYFRVGQKILIFYPDFHRWMSNHREGKNHPEAEAVADEILKDLR